MKDAVGIAWLTEWRRERYLMKDAVGIAWLKEWRRIMTEMQAGQERRAALVALGTPPESIEYEYLVAWVKAVEEEPTP